LNICNHNWVSADNKYVSGAIVCTECKEIRAKGDENKIMIQRLEIIIGTATNNDIWLFNQEKREFDLKSDLLQVLKKHGLEQPDYIELEAGDPL